MSVDDRSGRAAMSLALIAAVLAIYLPDVGHGFVQDDFAWILHARSSDVVDALDRAFTTSLGFYRPLVTLSFAIDEWLFGLQPFGYGVTNLALALGCMVAIERLGRRLGLPSPYALLAAAVWIFNFHGINMGVLWLSGRSSLLSTLFGTLAAGAFEARRTMLTTVWVLLALLSKEDAVMLPFILAAWRLVTACSGGSKDPPLRISKDPGGSEDPTLRISKDPGGSEDPPLRSSKDPPLPISDDPPLRVSEDPRLRVAESPGRAPFIGRGGSLAGSPARQPRWGGFDPPRVLRDCWPLFVPLAVYAVLRSLSGAFTPLTAPDFYRFTMEPALLLRNLVEYLNRSVATGALVAIVLLAVARAKPRLDGIHATLVLKCALWWLGGFALTMWLPVRSSLYAVFPSVGVALIVAALAASLVPAWSVTRRRALVIAGLLLPLLLLPLYRVRNVRWVSLADLSTATLAHVQAMLPQLPEHAVIALIDDRDVRANFINAFSSLTPEASQLFLERGIELAIDAPPDASRPRVEVSLSDVVYTR